MRLGLMVLVLAACSSSAPRGPLWPKPTLPPADGGESLAPRATARAIAAAGDDKPAEGTADADKPAAPVPAVTTGAEPADKPATTTPEATPSEEELLITEEIVIEVGD